MSDLPQQTIGEQVGHEEPVGQPEPGGALPKPEPKKPGGLSRPTWIAIGVGGLLLSWLAAYGSGRYTVSVQREADRKRYDEDIAALNARLTTTQEKLRLRRAASHIFQAVLSLGERNFGTAEASLKSAAGEVELASPAPEGELARLAQELKEMRLVVSDDVTEQRRDLERRAKRLLEAVDRTDSGAL